jgi:hypothetical protein
MKRLRDRTLGAAVVLITCLAMAGCVGLPTEGPVVEATGAGREDIDRAADIDARPPTPGASRVQVVVGFLDAMTAWPIQTNIAQQYLTSDAAQRWHPEAGTIVYGESLPPEENARGARVELASADLLDSSGGWRGSLSAEDLVLDLRIVMEDGELRIANPPDALVVPARWFQQRFRQVSLYFLDPSGNLLELRDRLFAERADPAGALSELVKLVFERSQVEVFFTWLLSENRLGALGLQNVSHSLE